MINSDKLFKELINAGIKVSGCDSTGRVLDLQNKEIQTRPDVIAVITKHDPVPDDDVLLHKEYDLVGANSQAMIYALWKKVMQDDPADADALQSRIDQVDLA